MPTWLHNFAMRLRLSRLIWLVLIVLVLGVSGTVFQYWWKHQQLQALVSEVKKHEFNGIDLQHSGPRWLVKWAYRHNCLPWIEWLKTDIRTLHLRGSDIDDQWLHNIPRFSRVETLRMQETRITDSGMSTLADRTIMARLWVIDVDISDAGLASLRNQSSLVDLRLDGTRITDAGLVVLKELPQLRTLMLDHNHITDAGLRHLEELDLYWLMLTGTKVTEPAVTQFAKGRYQRSNDMLGSPPSQWEPLILLRSSGVGPESSSK